MTRNSGKVKVKNNEKLKKLEDLRSKIINEVFKEEERDVWFFPQRCGVRGYWGTQDIMFVGLNPSYGRFPSKYDEFFYKQLSKNKFGNTHITDLIKIREIGKYVESELIQKPEIFNRQLKYFSKEIKIIKPKLVVSLGRKAAELLEEHKERLRIGDKLREITHYAYRFKDKDFPTEMKKIKAEYDRIARKQKATF